MKKISEFLSEGFHFLMVKFSIYLNRLVFVMEEEQSCGGGYGLKPVLLARNLTLNSDAALDYTYVWSA